MRRHLRRRVLMPVAAVVMLSACAGGGDDDAALSRDEWRERAADRCAEARDAMVDASGTADPVARAAAQAEVVRSLTGDLRELEPPAEDRAAVRETLDALDGAAALAVEGVEARRGGDEAELGRLRDQVEDLQARSREVAAASASYGLNDCMAVPG